MRRRPTAATAFLFLLAVALVFLGTGCATTADKAILREGLDQSAKPMWAEHLAWAKEKQVRGELTAADVKIRADAQAAFDALIANDRVRDAKGGGLFGRP